MHYLVVIIYKFILTVRVVVLYNRLYNCVITSRKIHNDAFDQTFSVYVDTLDSLDESKKKKIAKTCVLFAFNDLA